LLASQTPSFFLPELLPKCCQICCHFLRRKLLQNNDLRYRDNRFGIKLPPRGLETSAASAYSAMGLCQSHLCSGADSGALPGDSGAIDPDLAKVIAHWPSLSLDVRAAILALIGGTSTPSN
jgi:hypothetical protein